MTNLRLGVVLQHLRRLTAQRHDDELPDGQLLERFARQRDESAFAALLRRHGPMVLGVCRGILRNAHDVEDAFQATFLILAQKAASIRQCASVGGWLHEVAAHVALKASAGAARRQLLKRREPDRTETDPLDDLTVRELRQVLHEELRRLPEKYRTPLVLCYLEGKTQEEAARQLGWPKRRVKDRLQQGRERLRRRLSQRGLAPAALGTALFAVDSVAATVPATLAGATLRSALNAAPLAPAVAALVQAGGAMLTASKAKVVVAMVLAMSLLSGAGVWVCRSWIAVAVASPVDPPAATADDRPKAASPKPETAKTVEIQGRVLDPDGKPKAGAKLLLLKKEVEIKQLGVTAADGRFSVAVMKEAIDLWGGYLIAQAGSFGLDFLDLYWWERGKPVELRLVKDNPIRGRIINTEGKPIRGVRVAAGKIETYLNDSLDSFLADWMKLFVANGSLGAHKQLWSRAGALFTATTDADGRFTLHGIGAERTVRLHFSGGGIADTSAWVVNRTGFDPKPYNQVNIDRDGRRSINWRWWILSGPDFSVVAETEKVIRGIVQDADTGEGRAGLEVLLTSYKDEPLQDALKAKTDAQGHYEIHGARKAKSYLITVPCDPATATMTSQVWTDDTPEYRPVIANLKVKKGVIVTGKVIDGTTGECLLGDVMGVVLRGNPFVKDYPEFASLFMSQCHSYSDTDASGSFRLVVIPGPVLLMGRGGGRSRILYKRAGADPKYPQYFTKDGIGFYGHNLMAPLQGQCKVLEIKPGVAVVKQDIVLEREKALTAVKIQDAEGKPLSGVEVWGMANGRKMWIPYGLLESDTCPVYGERTDKPQSLVLYQPDKKLAGTLTLKGNEKQPLVVRLGPVGGIKGRLLDAEGKPLAGITIDLLYREDAAQGIHQRIHEGKEIVSDASGAFAFADVNPEWKFELSFRRGRQPFESNTKSADSAIQVKSGERRDLGAIQLKPMSKKEDE
jgi:RNA polymerase sigma factor (sigma-70 family)